MEESQSDKFCSLQESSPAYVEEFELSCSNDRAKQEGAETALQADGQSVCRLFLVGCSCRGPN